MSKPKILFVLIDGLGDTSVSCLGNKTPLQAANIPFVDSLAKYGLNGFIDPVQVGLACGSDTAHLSLFGYHPQQYYRGRGSFESIGSGLDMEPTDIAFKSNFATIEIDQLPSNDNGSSNQPIVKRRRCDREFGSWGVPLCDEISRIKLPNYPSCEIICKYATEHRCACLIREHDAQFQLSDEITGTDPLKDGLPLRSCQSTNSNKYCPIYENMSRTCDIVNQLSDQITHLLSEHPINRDRITQGLSHTNCILLRGAGRLISAPSFFDHHGLHSCMIAPTAIIAGLGKSLQMHHIPVQQATGYYHTNLISKADKAVELLSSDSKYDFVFVHVKAVDDAGHDRNLDAKIKWIEKCDQMIQHIEQKLLSQNKQCNDEPVLICVTGDHSTPVVYGDHSCEPVPVVISTINNKNTSHKNNSRSNFDQLCRLDGVFQFNEIDAAYGQLGRFQGHHLMSTLIKCRDLVTSQTTQADLT